MSTSADICVVGGAGHIGLPLSIVFASKGQRVLIYDINPQTLETIQRGTMPFMERGAEPLLREALAAGRLSVTTHARDIAKVPTLIVTIGTPIDEFLNPSIKGFVRCFEELIPHLSDEQLIVLRSTVYPGATNWLGQFLESKGKRPHLACCPERIVQGQAIEEIQRLPQLISGTTPAAEERAVALFSLLTNELVRLQPMEAEFAKLFCNAYRYIQFAVSNQFYMMASSAGLDYYRILNGLKQHYDRMRDIPSAGLAAGPCLFKDTMQLTAFYDNEFSLGYTAMLINEGLPLHIARELGKSSDLSDLTIGLLGMAFKADIDDARSSLSYKLKKVLQFRAARVLTTDPYVNDPELLPLEQVIEKSDLLILCIPHRAYKPLDLKGKPVLDIWNFFGRGSQVDLSALNGARGAAKNSRAPARA